MVDSGSDQPPSFPELYRVLRAFVSQYERVKRAHPRGPISLKFHFGDKESESSVTTGDDEKMALFVVLMRPFFEETSIIHLPKVWNLIKGGPQVRFSEAEVKNVEQALENVKAGAIAYSRKGVKVGRDEFYRILADGSFFGSTEGASAEVSELERSMLRSFGWYQFLTFNVDVFRLPGRAVRIFGGAQTSNTASG